MLNHGESRCQPPLMATWMEENVHHPLMIYITDQDSEEGFDRSQVTWTRPNVSNMTKRE